MAVIPGTVGNDALFGTTGNDTIDGLGGNDNLRGLGGNDIINGDDTLTPATVGDDILDGGAGNDTLDGGDGNNILLGGSGNDTLTSGTGDDRLDGGAGTDTMTGGSGNDTYVVDNALDVVLEGGAAETDTVETSISYSLALTPNIENLTLLGTSGLHGTGNTGNNIIQGNSGSNVLDGGAGNDTIFGGLGSDSMIGGDGNDTFYVDNLNDKVIEAAGGASGTDIIDTIVSYKLAANIENLVLSENAFKINGTGNDLANTIFGNTKDNTLDGGVGADSLIGGGGNDVYIVDDPGDIVLGGAGTDTVRSGITFSLAANTLGVENLVLTGTIAIDGAGDGFDNIITGNTVINALTGGAGNDTFIVQNFADVVIEAVGGGTDLVKASVSYSLNSAGNAGSEIENLTLTGNAVSGTGNGFDNIITGNANSNTLDGGLGNDTLFGGTGGTDTLLGGAGDDIYIVNRTSGIIIIDSAGIHDTVNASVTYSLALLPSIEDLTLTGTANLNGTGNAASNIITGNTGNNTLNGGTGADTMAGGGGMDVYLVDAVNDQVTGGTGTVISSAVSYDMSLNALTVNNLTLTGAAVNGTGNALNNIFHGDSIADSFDGGAGSDTYFIKVGDTVNDTGPAPPGVDSDTIAVNFSFDLFQSMATVVISRVVVNTPMSIAGVENITLTGSTALNATGDAANNILTGNSGVNTLTGGDGSDIYVVNSLQDVVVEGAGLLGDVDAIQSSVSYSLAAQPNIENLALIGTGNINGTGNGADNTITGNAHNNILDGGGHITVDTLIGGLGNDTYIYHSGDIIIENPGEGIDTLKANISLDLSASGLNLADVDNLTLTGLAAINGTGNALNNVITGNSAANVLDGLAGADKMIGGGGNDTYFVDNSGDAIIDSGGKDIVFTGASYVLTSGVESLTLTGVGDLSGTGNTLTNVITGNAGNNILDGGAGGDTLIGGNGDDTYFVDNTNDVVVESINAGTDEVHASVAYILPHDVENLILAAAFAINGTGNALDNTLTGNELVNILHGVDGNDFIDGGLGDDQLFGDLGNDTLSGGAGLDAMTGGNGQDNFVFLAASAFTEIDVIKDYNILEGDVIDVKDVLASGTYVFGTDTLSDFVRVGGGFVQVDLDGAVGTADTWQTIAQITGLHVGDGVAFIDH